MSFETFKLDPRVQAGVQAAGYVAPTPIQVKSIPPIMEGRDVVGLAQTGTGKTAAYALPILNRLLNGRRGRVRALVVSPTRELAEQICQAFNELGRRTGLRSTAVYGGVGMEGQVWSLKGHAEIVVACPGRLLDHVWRGSIDLSEVEMLVIDEADRMFDLGFLPDIRSILRCLTAPRQTLLFSATMPADIRGLSGEALRDPVTVQVGMLAPAASVSHALYPVKQHLKTGMLLEILRGTETESVLVFTRTKYRAERVAQELSRAGHRVTCLQGNMSQYRRQAALDGFRSGWFKILVATDIAARGIDVLNISHVINYDMPESTDAYTHRIGRTGRVDRKGEAFTFVTGEDADEIRDIERVLNMKLERRILEGFAYDSPAPPRESGHGRRPASRWSGHKEAVGAWKPSRA